MLYSCLQPGGAALFSIQVILQLLLAFEDLEASSALNKEMCPLQVLPECI